MEKISVSICTNQVCFTAGATLFKHLDHIMCTSLKSKINLTGTDCLGHCTALGASQAPFAKVNERLIFNATPGTVIQAIKECLCEKRRVA